jgi:hypothetical protein
VRLLEALEGTAVGQVEGGPLIATAVQVEEVLQGLASQAKDLLPNAAFDFVNGRSGMSGLKQEGL